MKTKVVDAVISLLGAFGVFYPLQTMENFWFGLVLGLVAAASVALIVWFTIRKAREVTIPEALAYGYFGSFLEPVISNTGKEAVINVNGKTKRYSGKNLRFRILIPESLDVLGETMDKLEHSHQSASLSIEDDRKPFGIYIDNNDSNLEIADVPNTLRALVLYLKRIKNKNPDLKPGKVEIMSKRMLEEFKSALNEMIEENKDQIDGLRKKVTIEQSAVNG